MFTALIPDMDYFMGHHGGRVLPLYRDAAAKAPNLVPGLLAFLANQFNHPVAASDVIEYLAAVLAHPGFVRRYASELRTPGVRVPLTRDRSLWAEAVRTGREIIWLHTYGERCVDPRSGRPSRPPRMSSNRPKVQVGIPDTEASMPEHISYDEDSRTLHVGDGRIAPVASEVWSYQVSGMWVIKHWFGYRRKNPAGNRQSPLNGIVARTWTADMTTELLDLLNVLGRCVALEPHQDELLGRIADGPLITVDDLTIAGLLPVPATAKSVPKPDKGDDLFTAGRGAHSTDSESH